MSGFKQLPRDGDVVALGHSGKFIGKINQPNKDL